MNFRKLAEGRPCTVRLPGCDGGGDTTVLAHYPLKGYTGMGMKPPDYMGAHACHNCHELLDGRRMLANLSKAELRLAHCEAILRTLAALWDGGYLGPTR